LRKVEKIREEEEDGDEVRVDELAIDEAALDESLGVAVGTYNI